MATLSGEWLLQKYKAEAMMQHQVAQHASPNPGPDPVRPEDIPIAPSSPYEKGKSPHKFLAGNPSFDINETPATRRIRKIRTLQERGVGGEKGNAGDILKKGIQLPNIQAKVNYGEPTPLDKYFEKVGYPNKDMSPEQRLKIMRGAPKV